MTECEWLFLNKDKSKEVVTLQGSAPIPGDGKVHNKIGYVVRYVVSGRTTSPNDFVIATEHD